MTDGNTCELASLHSSHRRLEAQDSIVCVSSHSGPGPGVMLAPLLEKRSKVQRIYDMFRHRKVRATLNTGGRGKNGRSW